MTDSELLEFAAKAAGVVWIDNNFPYDEFGRMMLDFGNGNTEWNPLTNDGDALRLAVKLRLMISWHEPRDLRVIWWNAEERKEILETWTEAHDSCACSRRAIVRAAAEIGKEMK